MPALQKELDIKLVRAVVHSGSAFNIVEDPYVLDLLSSGPISACG